MCFSQPADDHEWDNISSNAENHNNQLMEENEIENGSNMIWPAPIMPVIVPPYFGERPFQRETVTIRRLILELHERFMASSWNHFWTHLLNRTGGLEAVIHGIVQWLMVLDQGKLPDEYGYIYEWQNIGSDFGVNEETIWHLFFLRRCIRAPNMKLTVELYTDLLYGLGLAQWLDPLYTSLAAKIADLIQEIEDSEL